MPTTVNLRSCVCPSGSPWRGEISSPSFTSISRATFAPTTASKKPCSLLVLLEVPPLGKLELAVVLDVVHQVVEQGGRGADDAEPAEIVAQAQRNGHFGHQAVLAVAAQLDRRAVGRLPAGIGGQRQADGRQRLRQGHAGQTLIAGERRQLRRLPGRFVRAIGERLFQQAGRARPAAGTRGSTSTRCSRPAG